MKEFEDNSLSERLFRGAGYIVAFIGVLFIIALHIVIYALAFAIALLIRLIKISFTPV